MACFVQTVEVCEHCEPQLILAYCHKGRFRLHHSYIQYDVKSDLVPVLESGRKRKTKAILTFPLTFFPSCFHSHTLRGVILIFEQYGSDRIVSQADPLAG
jgi:hypothetical protein